MQERIEFAITFLTDWLHSTVLTGTMLAQWGCVVGTYLVTALLWRGLERRLFAWVDTTIENALGRSLLRALVDVGNVAMFIVFMQVCAAVFWSMNMTPRVLNAASDLAVAWIIIRFLTGMMPNNPLARGVALIVWSVAALSIFGLLTPITDFLEGLRMTVGGTSFTALGVIKGFALAALFLQAAATVAQFATSRINAISGLSPSVQVLMTKAVKVGLYTTAILFAMSSVGIDLTSLAIFSSALGVGIGFGLKTIFSNYVAGILLLMDKSIKPGDTIEVGSVFGVVREMHGRYTSILTRDGMEYLIPNELLISGEVINWTYSDRNVRIKIPVGIAYESDVEKAMELLSKACVGVKRVLRNPAPASRLMGFGDSSVDLQLRIWISDAEDGVANVRSEILLNVWNLFHEHGIEFPFPQRDMFLKSGSSLSVTLEKEAAQE
nr:mechanosensitive ion channel domain-containing protein [uncultured Pseudodesulfovibrio sp.]